MKFLPLILVGIAYFANYPVLLELYPDLATDHEQYSKFIMAKDQIYEAMLAGLFLTLFLNTKGLLKAIACGFLILTVSSFIDKSVYGFTHYLYSDILLVVLSAILSIYVYVRESKRSTG